MNHGISAAVTTEVTHEVTLSAPPERPILVIDGDEQVACQTVTVSVYTDADGRLKQVGTRFVARGHAVNAAGTITRSPRLVQGSNLSRLPAEARTAVLYALGERIIDDRGQVS